MDITLSCSSEINLARRSTDLSRSKFFKSFSAGCLVTADSAIIISYQIQKPVKLLYLRLYSWAEGCMPSRSFPVPGGLAFGFFLTFGAVWIWLVGHLIFIAFYYV